MDRQQNNSSTSTSSPTSTSRNTATAMPPSLLCMFSSLRHCVPIADELAFVQATRGSRMVRVDADDKSTVSLWAIRQQVTAALQSGSSHAMALQSFSLLQQYAAALAELPEAPLETTWRNAAAAASSDNNATSTTTTTFYSLHWERCNVLWNMVALLAYQSTVTATENFSGKGSIKAQPSQQQQLQQQQPFWYLQAAASLCQTLCKTVQELQKQSQSSASSASPTSLCVELSPVFLQVWQDVLLAHAQRVAYDTFYQLQQSSQQPRHFLLASLATAAVPLFAAAEVSCEAALQDEWILKAAENTHNGASRSFWSLLDSWNQAIQAWGMYLNSMAEYHEALKHQQQHAAAAQKEPGAPVSPLQQARLDAAIRYAELAQLFLEQADDCDNASQEHLCVETSRLDALVRHALEKMLSDMDQLQQQQGSPDHPYDNSAQQNVPEELPVIRPQQTVKLLVTTDVKILPTLEQLRLTMATSNVHELNVSLHRNSMPQRMNTSSSRRNVQDMNASSSNRHAQDLNVSSSHRNMQQDLGSSSSHRTPPTSNHYPPTSFLTTRGQTPPSTLSSPAVSGASSGLLMTPSMYQRYRQSFLHQLLDLHQELTTLAQNKTEAGRLALGAVKLPHALTAYHHQEQQQQQESGFSGQTRRNALPPQLWARVAAVQAQYRKDDGQGHSRGNNQYGLQNQRGSKSDYISTLQQQLWELRDSADVARSLLKQVDQQLTEDLEMDRTFRQDAKHAEFAGHDVMEVQRAVRESLSNYKNLLETARQSDEVMWEQSLPLQSDPKFQLLKFDKEQLENLIEPSYTAPPTQDGRSSRSEVINISMLSKHLVEMSALFEMRESNLQVMHRRIHDFPFEEELLGLISSGVGAEQALSTAVEQAKEAVQVFVDKVEASIERQAELLRSILQENDEFVRHRDSARPASGDNCIAKLEAALDEIDDFAKHLVEGKDFYDVVIPKLERLKMQVEDVSARLTIERMEFEDRIAMSRQEAEDARMAARVAEQQQQQRQQQHRVDGQTNSGAPLAAINPSPLAHQGSPNPYYGGMRSSSSSIGSAQQPNRLEPASHPGVEQVDHTAPMVRVDDSKVATLVAMDFDPDKVVAALRLYDNNFDQALNELLSG